MNPLSILTGGFGLSASSSATSGDISVNPALAPSFNNAFAVGKGANATSETTPPGGSNTLVVVGIAVGALGLLLGAAAFLRK